MRGASDVVGVSPPPTLELYGSVLSPFSVKVARLCEHAAIPYRWSPAQTSVRAGLEVQLRRWALTRGLRPATHPRPGLFDEHPLVPFLFGPDGLSLWDSSAIGRWLDRRGAPGLLPADRLGRFVCGLVDEAIDEIGLYLLHHERWVGSARRTVALEHLRDEFAPLLTAPVARPATRAFGRRQVRRLPYLFSVAPPGYAIAGLDARMQPPARAGFPPTHALLERLFDELLDAAEHVLGARPHLLGDAPTLADASLHGMLASMCRLDPDAEARIRRRAPTVRAWVDRPAARPRRVPAAVDAALEPLLAWVGRAFVPLMRANEAAFRRCCARGQRTFDEAAFDAGEALFDGELAGAPYRTVVKTFQVKVWRRLAAEHASLEDDDRRSLARRAPGLGLERLGGGRTPRPASS
ncbi:MAG TPA: glutathione S-transferase family protein [Sandaracinaceae bacterium LLY-WYZ-13_1]|nr:glutathione S-transferase family protein [Sandaracinaceae bacterium LLY-WYZ-13_1]